MPLTKSGHKILSHFEREYGKKRGKSIFYATIRSHPRMTAKWHNMSIHSGIKPHSHYHKIVNHKRILSDYGHSDGFRKEYNRLTLH